MPTIGFAQLINIKKVMDWVHYIWKRSQKIGMELKISICHGIF